MKTNSPTPKKVAPIAVSKASELKRAGAQAAGSRRTDAFYDKWRTALTAIEQEVIHNKGVYPHNGGNLNLTETARRAGVVMNSLYPARHAEFKMEVEDFIDRMNEIAPTSKPVDHAPAPTWEELYKSTITNYQVDALAWRSDRARRESAERHVEELQISVARHQATIEELARQLTELTQGRIVPLGAKKGGRRRPTRT